jgi:heme/copper-type cytochrome/quinol oxidase subunit 2
MWLVPVAIVAVLSVYLWTFTHELDPYRSLAADKPPLMVTQLNLKADRTGDFEGMNTQYNGDGFHAQHFQAVAMTSQDFDSWVKRALQNSVALNGANYRILAESSTPAEVHNQFGDAAIPKGVTFFNDVAPNLFATIVSRYSASAVSARWGWSPPNTGS